jgi:hypothetical protein
MIAQVLGLDTAAGGKKAADVGGSTAFENETSNASAAFVDDEAAIPNGNADIDIGTNIHKEDVHGSTGEIRPTVGNGINSGVGGASAKDHAVAAVLRRFGRQHFDRKYSFDPTVCLHALSCTRLLLACTFLHALFCHRLTFVLAVTRNRLPAEAMELKAKGTMARNSRSWV